MHLRNHSSGILKAIWLVYECISIAVAVTGIIMMWKRLRPRPSDVLGHTGSNRADGTIQNRYTIWKRPMYIGGLSLISLVAPVLDPNGNWIGTMAFILALILSIWKR